VQRCGSPAALFARAHASECSGCRCSPFHCLCHSLAALVANTKFESKHAFVDIPSSGERGLSPLVPPYNPALSSAVLLEVLIRHQLTQYSGNHIFWEPGIILQGKQPQPQPQRQSYQGLENGKVANKGDPRVNQGLNRVSAQTH
jgi:hypothetical protein